ncbi:helix-turn-helix domain-containing protein [Planctopirus hydrillae]|uniref:Uncharacterized protein n=1 Tax=Planctopirus hydrillae TaxID=1841610 RepID=A0A1C3EFW6_9PLAN|nr:helix-turn-helix domain-containing protein [Planctopirus hydrillae]ODA32128.1 hypothetical protein A6X21_21695 [Planctopirus hydrillae]
MAIDLRAEQLILLGEACRRLSVVASPPTLWRWRTRGVNGVKLECVRAGRKWYTTYEALNRFLDAQSSLPVPSPAPKSQELSIRSDKTHDRLKAAGLL